MLKILMTLGLSAVLAQVGISCLEATLGDDLGSLVHVSIVLTSMLYWSFVSYRIRHGDGRLWSAMVCGIMSPFIGTFIAGMPFGIGSLAGFILAAQFFYITVPVGMMAGLVVWSINRQPATPPPSAALQPPHHPRP